MVAKTTLKFAGYLALWVAVSILVFNIWISGTDHRDFYPWWAGSRLAMFEDRDLYALDTVREMQMELYGRILPPEVDQQGFAYPATLVVVFFPFWLIDNVEIATAIWVGFSVLVSFLVLGLLRQLNQKAPLWGTVLFFFWYFPFLVFFQGQITGVLLALVGLSYWAFEKNRDILAGVTIAAALVKPDLVFLPAIIILLLSLQKRRIKVLVSFSVALTLIFLASFAIVGFWIPGWLAAISRYSAYARFNWALGVAWDLTPILGLLVVAILVLTLIRFWDQPRTIFAASIPAGMLLFPQTLIWGLMMLLIPFTLFWNSRTRWLILGIWVLGWMSIIGNLYFNEWWRVQSIGFPLISLLIVWFDFKRMNASPASIRPPPDTT